MPALSTDFGLAGAGLSIGGGIFSAITGSEDANRETGIENNITGLQIQQNQVKENAMELATRRLQGENVRKMQMARSMALSTATGQGSQFGSDLGGAYGSISGQTNNNQLGLSQNLQTGEQMFQLTNQISDEQVALANAQKKAASDAAIGKMFGGIGSSMGTIGKLLTGIPGLGF